MEPEIERLRREVAALRAERAEYTAQSARTARAARAGRWVGAVALLVVGVLLIVASIAAVFVRNQLLNTDRYVATVAPLAQNPVIQDAVATRLASEVVTRVDLAGLADEAAVWLVRQGAPPRLTALVEPAVDGVESFLRTQIRRIVATEQFADAWQAANRIGHEGLVTVLTGGTSGAVTSTGTTVTVNLGVFLDLVKQRLVAAGFTLAARIPQVSIPFTVFSSPQLPTIRTYVRWLNRAATWLPWVAVLLLVAAVAAAPDRRRGLLITGLGLAIGLLLARVGVTAAQDWYLDRLPPAVQSPQAVAQILDILLRRVRSVVTWLIVIGFLIALGAWLAGPGRVPVLLRRWARRLVNSAQNLVNKAYRHREIGGTP